MQHVRPLRLLACVREEVQQRACTQRPLRTQFELSLKCRRTFQNQPMHGLAHLEVGRLFSERAVLAGLLAPLLCDALRAGT